MERMLSPRDITALVPVSYDTILKAIRAGELRAAEVHRRYVVRESDLEQWIESNVVTAPNPRPLGTPRASAGGAVTRLPLTGRRGFQAEAKRRGERP